MNRWRVGYWSAVSLAVLMLVLQLTVNFREPHELGITWNLFSGERSAQVRGGWNIRPPWVLLSEVDTRPQRVCITSSSHAAANCKLVQFVPEHYQEFLAQEGFRWYWWANRVSINWGHEETYRGMQDILRGYAFSSEQYPFVRVLDEYELSSP